MKQKERIVGLDLLRILAMFFVVVVHVLGQGGVMEKAMSVSKWHYYPLKLIQAVAYCAVPCYAILSGYVGVDKKWKPSNLISLVFTALFYTIGFSVLFYLLKPKEIGFSGMLRGMLPDYWYLVCYFGLFFFMPLLNKTLEAISQKMIFCILLLMFFVFSMTSPILMAIKRDPFRLLEGFSVIWLLVLYLVGGYLKLYGICKNRLKLKMVMLFLLSIFITLLSKGLTNELGYGNMNLLYHYTSPTIFLASVALVVLFANMDIRWKKKGIITYFSTFTFAVYLIHQQQFVNIYCIENQFLWVLEYHWIISVLAVLGGALLIYLICSIMDMIRFYIFQWLRLKQFAVWIEKTCARAIDWLTIKMGINE